MTIDGQTDETIRTILTYTRRVAVVGASDKPWRPSHGVFRFLLAGRAIHDRTVVASLAEAVPLDMVDIFRASANAGAAVDDAIRFGARTVWMQLGVVDKVAAELARAAGIVVVMDRCPMIEVRRLRLSHH
jgi:predicted CoA-binding protein